MEPKNWFQGIDSASLCGLTGRYDNSIHTQFLAPIDCSKIPAQSRKFKTRCGRRSRFQEPSLELSSQASKAGGPVRQPYAYLVPSPQSGTKHWKKYWSEILSLFRITILPTVFSISVVQNLCSSPRSFFLDHRGRKNFFDSGDDKKFDISVKKTFPLYLFK